MTVIANLKLIENGITQQEYEDWVKFFTTEKGVDMLPYIYQSADKSYNELIKNCDGYYLCQDEAEIVSNNHELIKKTLNDVEVVIELGPGSEHPVRKKTVPFLKSCLSINEYIAIDHEEEYVVTTKKIVAAQFPNVSVSVQLADILLDEFHIIKNKINCFLIFGGTIANFKQNDRMDILSRISVAITPKDYCVISVDTNQDVESINGAYNSIQGHQFIKSGLHTIARKVPEFKKHIDDFEITWLADDNNCASAQYIAKKNMYFCLNDRTINILEGQVLKGAWSQKFSEKDFTTLLENCGLDVIQILNNSNKMRMFICRKKI